MGNFRFSNLGIGNFRESKPEWQSQGVKLQVFKPKGMGNFSASQTEEWETHHEFSNLRGRVKGVNSLTKSKGKEGECEASQTGEASFD